MKLKEKTELLLLNRLFNSGTREICTLLRSGTPSAEILERIRHENLWGKREALEQAGKSFNPDREFEQTAQKGIQVIAFSDPEYPSLLKQIPDPPIVLYILGNLDDTDRAAIAVVGARNASQYGLFHARKMSAELAQSGWTLVSGMARGIDEAAHEGALQIPYGRTVAVLGSGVDHVYPRENKKLYDRIRERGAVISEFPLGTPPLAHHFPRRNRIISGLSLGVLVVEAHLRSGSLITAREALDQGREVFAVPGPIDQLTSKGTHQLIRDGACLADSSAVILQTLAPMYQFLFAASAVPETARNDFNVQMPVSEQKEADESSRPEELEKRNDNNDKKDALIKMVSAGPKSYDELLTLWKGEASKLFSTLLELEIEGTVLKTPEGRFTLSLSEKAF